ncbi:hypothetical protein [Paenibacillus alvei]|uniref:hypothetical protein n=1 Tax=Paenibacillus alvei TaxID=44250 RepID=UPI0019D5D0F2|nr:hypothetical protein [Paenibacillus alvei]MBG9736325.1 hypothetical protein [Paenibacillus alvei]MBG9742932.1 hypothetical protein [Paenibacillus alvei]
MYKILQTIYNAMYGVLLNLPIIDNDNHYSGSARNWKGDAGMLGVKIKEPDIAQKQQNGD